MPIALAGFLVVGTFVSMVPLLLFRAWVTTVLWGWFAVRLGLPPLTMAWAVGISCLVSMFITPKRSKQEGEDPFAKIAISFLESLAYSVLGLLVGWIALQWMPA